MPETDVRQNLREGRRTPQDLKEDLEEQGEPVHESSPSLQRPGHVHIRALQMLLRHGWGQQTVTELKG